MVHAARDRPWTAFCEGVQQRHATADSDLLYHLHGKCRGALQAVADAEQELTRCRYSSVTVCDPRRWMHAAAVRSRTE